MVVTFAGWNKAKKFKLCIKILILAVILFYILPKLLSLLWYVNSIEPKIQNEQLLEKPLRVIANIVIA